MWFDSLNMWKVRTGRRPQWQFIIEHYIIYFNVGHFSLNKTEGDLPCLKRGKNSFGPAIFPFCRPPPPPAKFLVINDRSLCQQYQDARGCGFPTILMTFVGFDPRGSQLDPLNHPNDRHSFGLWGPATRCDAVHPRWDITKPLWYIKIACDVLRCIFQHVGISAPDSWLSQTVCSIVIVIPEALYVGKNYQISISDYNRCDDHRRRIWKHSIVSRWLATLLWF